MDLKDRIKELCKKNHISMNQLEQDLDFGKGYISKLGKSTPNATKIKQIAEYFNVSVDYLMTGENSDTETGYYLNKETAKAAQEIFEAYRDRRITSSEAAQKLGVSTSTFLRRYKEYSNI